MRKYLFIVALLVACNCFPQEPIVVFPAENTNGYFRRVTCPINNITGKHRIHIVWRNHDSVVKNIFLDKSELNSIENSTEGSSCKVLSGKNAIAISDISTETHVKVYNTMGALIVSVFATESFYEIPVPKGLYIVHLTVGNKTTSEKVISY